MHSVETQRVRLLVQLERMLERPMIVLSLVWVALVAIGFAQGLTRAVEIAGLVIWALFALGFVVKLLVAPRKWLFLRPNWEECSTMHATSLIDCTGSRLQPGSKHERAEEDLHAAELLETHSVVAGTLLSPLLDR